MRLGYCVRSILESTFECFSVATVYGCKIISFKMNIVMPNFKFKKFVRCAHKKKSSLKNFTIHNTEEILSCSLAWWLV